MSLFLKNIKSLLVHKDSQRSFLQNENLWLPYYIYYISAVKRLILINCIQNKSVCIIYVRVFCVYYYVYKYTRAVYILKVFTCIYVYIYIHVIYIINIFDI